MDISTVKTIACIVPTENAEGREQASDTFVPHNVTQRRVGQECEIKLTSNWKVDRVGSDLTEETSKIVDSALSGYDAACLFISVSEEYKGAMYKQRRNNLIAILDNLKSRIGIQSECVTIEYANIAMDDRDCFDFKRKLSRSNNSMIQMGMDSIMHEAKSVDDIKSTIEEDPLPFILNIKLTNNSKNTMGRLVIIDLYHPRFTASSRSIEDPIYESFDYFKYIVENMNAPNCKKEFKTNSSVLTNETVKYICGNCRLVVVGYINDKIVNDVHSKETRSLLSFVSSFKNKPVHALPNNTLQETFVYKSLLAEEKKIKRINDALKSSNSKLKEHLSEQDVIIKRLESKLNNLRSESREKCQNQIGLKEKKALLELLDKQVDYLKAEIGSQAALHEYDKLVLEINLERKKGMLAIKKFATQDLLLESQSRKRRYEQDYNDINNKVAESEKEVHHLETEVESLRQKLLDLNRSKPQKVKVQNPACIAKDEHLNKDHKSTEDQDLNVKGEHLNEDQKLITTDYKLDEDQEKKVNKKQKRTVTKPNTINEERKKRLEESKLLYQELKEKLKKAEEESTKFSETAKENYQKEAELLKKKLEYLKKEAKKEKSAIKETANHRMNAINRKYQDKLADQEKEIEKLKIELHKARPSNRKKAKK